LPLTDQNLNIMVSYISRLLIRQGEVSIELGRLVVRQPNGEEMSHDWLKKYEAVLLREILTTLKIDSYEYRSYSTGSYDQRKFPGINLQFRSTVDEKYTYVIFNVSLTRIRSIKSGVKGSPLPKGHFHVGERSNFFKFWRSTPLAVPKSLTSFHDYMGNLKNILFAANLTEGRDDGRMDAGSIRPLSVSSELVREKFLPDNSRIVTGYAPDNCRIKNPDRDSAASHALRGFQPKSTTGDQYYGKAVIRKIDDTGPSQAPLRIRPQEQTVDEWTVDFCS
jgi:hypothetical protein